MNYCTKRNQEAAVIILMQRFKEASCAGTCRFSPVHQSVRSVTSSCFDCVPHLEPESYITETTHKPSEDATEMAAEWNLLHAACITADLYGHSSGAAAAVPHLALRGRSMTKMIRNQPSVMSGMVKSIGEDEDESIPVARLRPTGAENNSCIKLY